MPAILTEGLFQIHCLIHYKLIIHFLMAFTLIFYLLFISIAFISNLITFISIHLHIFYSFPLISVSLFLKTISPIFIHTIFLYIHISNYSPPLSIIFLAPLTSPEFHSYLIVSIIDSNTSPKT